MAAIYPENIPPEAKNLNQWDCYKLEMVDGDKTKVPYNPTIGQRASSTDPQTWVAFTVALAAYRDLELYDGICFFVTEESGIVFIDLDKCIKDGKIEPWALEIVKNFNSYTEKSQSGKGLHILIKGKKPGKRCSTSKFPHDVEIYDHARQCCLTGDVLEGHSTIEPCQDALNVLYSEIFGEEKPHHAAAAPGLSCLSDQQVIRRAILATNGNEFDALWNGSLLGYNGDESGADLALMNHLAFYCGGDRLQMERLFSASALGRRDKWISRQDYRERTIDRALEGRTEFYKPRAEETEAERIHRLHAEANPPMTRARADMIEAKTGVHIYNAIDDPKPNEITEEELKELPITFNPRLEVHLEDSNFMTRYMVYAKTTSDAYEEYHFASALVLLSVAADRQIVISMKHGDIYPNIWIFPIGDSTVSRKTTAHKLCKLILKSKYPKRSLPSSFSPEALMDAISATPRCYYLKDEAGSLLASLCKEYMAETRDFLAEIYECDDYYRKLKKSECQITDPYITQYLMTTPDNLKEYTTPLDLTSGWLLRYLWMYPNYPKEWKPFAEKDESDFDRFATITGEYNQIVEKLTTPRRLAMTEESMQFFQEWHKAIEETAMKEADNITKALAGRLMTYAIKMAALFTIGRADFDENSKIELPHIKEAARLVTEYFLPIGRIIVDEVARAESKNLQEKILGTLKRFNGRISQRDLLRVLHTKLSDVEDAIKALMLSEEIQSIQVKGKKCTILHYVSVKSKIEECHSVIVSHDEVYKGKSDDLNKTNPNIPLYTTHLDTMSLLQVGQDQGCGVDEEESPASGPHPRQSEPTPAKPKEDPGLAKFKAGHAAHRARHDKHTCSRCGKHDDIPFVMRDHNGYYCETCRRDGPPEVTEKPPKVDAQARLGDGA